jgi:hypothetical protein
MLVVATVGVAGRVMMTGHRFSSLIGRAAESGLDAGRLSSVTLRHAPAPAGSTRPLVTHLGIVLGLGRRSAAACARTADLI